jgi:hypothetical protein
MSLETTPNDILLNEIFPKMSINGLMILRQTDKRLRQLVSEYLDISEKPTTILSIYNRSDTFYTKENTFEIMMYFEKEYKFERRDDYTDYMTYWFSKEIVCVIYYDDERHFFYFDKNKTGNETQNGKWRFLNYKLSNVIIKSLPEYIFHNYYILNDKEDAEDDEEIDISIDLFYKGYHLKSTLDTFIKSDYDDEELQDETKKEEIIKYYTRFFTKCFHLMNYIDVE